MTSLDRLALLMFRQFSPTEQQAIIDMTRNLVAQQSDANATPDGKEPADESR